MIEIEHLVSGHSYACRFRHGDYEGIGVLLTRDVAQQLVTLRDTHSLMQFVVSFDNIWDIDHVNWSDEAQS